MSRVTIRSGALHVEIKGEGPPLLLVAGLGGRGAFWRAQVPALSDRFRVVLHDHRGVGSSAREGVASSTAEMAHDLLQLMDALEIERAHIVGHSTGGAMAQHLALAHPGRIARLVLSATWARPDPLFLALFAMRKRVLSALGPADYLMLGNVLGFPTDWLDRSFRTRDDFVAERLADFPAIEDEMTRLDAVMGHDLGDRVAEIRVPTLVISAADDQLTPLHFHRELAARIPGAKSVILPRGGHFCAQTEPEAYTRAIRAFLTEGTA